MNKIDYEFYSLIKKLELMSKEEIFLNIKNRYLALNEELRNNIETFLNSFSFWGKLEYLNNDFTEIKNVTEFLNNNLTDLVILYQNLKDYKSKKILLAILRNYYYYDFTMLHEVMDTCYKHYFDLDLVKTTKDTVYVDVGSYIGDSIDDFLDSYMEEYKKIYCYEVTDTSIATLKDKFVFNKDIIIKPVITVENRHKSSHLSSMPDMIWRIPGLVYTIHKRVCAASNSCERPENKIMH